MVTDERTRAATRPAFTVDDTGKNTGRVTISPSSPMPTCLKQEPNIKTRVQCVKAKWNTPPYF